MNYLDLYGSMRELGMIRDNWKHTIRLIQEELTMAKVPDDDAYMKLFICYFSLIDEGNVYMSLDENTLDEKFRAKIAGLKSQFAEEDYEKNDHLDAILAGIREAYPYLKTVGSLPTVGVSSLFLVDNGKLFTRKYYHAVNGILDSVKRLFKQNPAAISPFDYQSVLKGSFQLTKEQREVIEKGYYNNLFVTGGPGTGKTTSIFFLLLSLLVENPTYHVYLTAPSGKAKARMKESIQDNIRYADTSSQNVASAVEAIKSLKECTIHKLLQPDYSNNGFKYNQFNQFEDNSVFVIDEASMIDVCLFDSLLTAIPDRARVFILGDKDQLPSVECGAVFGNLLKDSVAENNVLLVESKRFPKDSDIFKLAASVNSGAALPVSNMDWKPWTDFAVSAVGTGIITPIYYYSDEARNQTEMINKVTEVWYREYYEKLKAMSIDLDDNQPERFEELYKASETARILCASHVTARGANQINKDILKKYFDQKDKISGFNPGELLKINTNSSTLDLNNGDCGIAVKFSGDESLYIMFKKTVSLKLDEGKVDNRIFKIGEFVFYPAGKIGRDIIDSAFAITIHTSQGSDYDNILVILPKTKGHPLLNRQIVYTAITRTKGTTYILSNQENLEYARDTVLVRDTY